MIVSPSTFYLSPTLFLVVDLLFQSELVCWVPETTPSELERATAGALEAYRKWRDVPIQQRQRVFFRLQQLIREHTEELAVSITTEQGQTNNILYHYALSIYIFYQYIL